jgi:hypothetical protein
MAADCAVRPNHWTERDVTRSGSDRSSLRFGRILPLADGDVPQVDVTVRERLGRRDGRVADRANRDRPETNRGATVRRIPRPEA